MRTYACPDCGGQFDFLHMRREDPPPAGCKLCGADMTGVAPEISAPHIARSIGKVADNVYRQMETASEARAEMAAEAMGVPVSEMSAMKITDLKDNARAGEITAVAAPASNPVSDFMGRASGATGVISADQGMEYARATRSGPYAGAGASVMGPLATQHWSTAARVAAAGNLGRAK